jgi:predicted DNA-binding transcriptional regulator YafY
VQRDINRFDRVTAILIHLQSRKVVKAQDLAERFSVSIRTVYRDIRTLERAGIPIVSEAGIGYSIMEGYRLPPVLFTKGEAASMLTAEKLIEKIADPKTAAQYKSAMYKIRSVLTSNEKDLLEQIDGHIEVLSSLSDRRSPAKLHSLHDILIGITERRVIFIRYYTRSKRENTERYVEPIGIFYSGSKWHLIAYCRLREDYRDFRIDRISGLRITDGSFDARHPSLREYLERSHDGAEYRKIVIKVNSSVTHYIDEARYYYGFVEEKESGGYTTMTFMAADPEGFARWYLTFADHAYILEPGAFKKRVKELLAAISSRQ